MGYERREGDGVLFKNERKQRENQPDYTGNALIGGVEHDIAAWVKESRNGGKKFFSLSIKPRERENEGDDYQRGRGSEGRWGGNSQARSAPERSGGFRSPPPEDDLLPF